MFALSNKAVREAVQLEDEFGLHARYVTGDNLSLLDRSGKEFEARAMVKADGEIIVRADHPEFTPKQLLRHEIGHLQIRRGEISVEEVRNNIVKKFGEEYLSWAIEQYAAAYNLTGYSADAVFEEIICDALGDMNAFAEDVKPLVTYFVTSVKQAAEESSETTRDRGPPSETETSSEAKFSIARTSKMTLKEQLHDYYNGKLQSSDSFYFGITPSVLKQSGLDGLPLGFTIRDFRKSTKEKHNIPRRVLNNLYSSLENALLTFTNGDRVGVLTADIDGDGKPLLVAIQSRATMDRKDVNAITSIYGLDNPGEWLQNQTDAGKTLQILDEKRASTFLQTYGYSASVEGNAYSLNKIVASASANVNPQSQENSADEDSFSLERPVERVRDLVAVHNLSMQQLEQSLDLGGLPMPSIAIIKAEQGHSEYGDVSLVFGKQTIDPEANRNNKVYGGDAWTPTYPRVEYKASEAAERRLSSKYYELSKKLGHDATRPLYRYANELEDTLNRAGSTEALMDDVRNDTGLMQLYLDDSGKGHVEDITRTTRTELSTEKKAQNQQWIDALGESAIRGFKAPEGVKPMAYRRQYIAEHKSEILDAYEQQLRQQGLSDTEAAQKRDAVKNVEIMTWMRDALAYLNNGGVTERTEVDTAATDEAIRAKAADGYEAWVNELFSGVAEKSGIRNNQDNFTSRGNRRSWEALHWENNLENVVKAMRQQEATGNAFFGGLGIWGAAAKQYGTLNEVRADEGRLQSIPQEQYDAIKENYGQRFTEIAQSIVTRSSSGNPYIELDTACENIVDAIRKTKTKSGLLHYLQQYNPAATTATVDDIVQLVRDISNMPTGYFEAKPRRAVGFNEVATAIVPDSAPQSLRGKLDSAGVRTVYYTAGDEDARKSALNGLEGVKFSRERASAQAQITTDFGVTVDKILNGSTVPNDAVLIGYTPSIYEQMGMPSLPFVIGVGHIYSTAKTETEAKRENRYHKGTHYHGLGAQRVKAIYQEISNPVMVIASKTVKPNATPLRNTHSVVAIVNLGTKNEKLLIPVEIAATRTVNGMGMDVNVLSSVYEKNVSNLIQEAIARENIGDVGIYYAKKQASTLVSVGIQFPKQLQGLASDTILHQISEKVNRNVSKQTESQQFTRWFGDWQNHPENINPFLLNDDGTPKRFYHGTPNGTFSTFKEWQYFTDNKAYADLYQDQDASINGYKKTANNRYTYEVYLAPKKIFDTRKPKEQKIFQNEFYQQWGNGAPLSDKGLPDWTDGDDLIEFFDEKGYDYDAFLLDEGGTGGYGTEVKSRGISIVVRDSSAIKSATEKSKATARISLQFSLQFCFAESNFQRKNKKSTFNFESKKVRSFRIYAENKQQTRLKLKFRRVCCGGVRGI